MSFRSLLKSFVPWPVVAAFFLVPAAWMPWTTDPLEPNKFALLALLAFLSLGAWIASTLWDGSLRVKGGWVNALPVPLVIAVLASAAFSKAGYVSWVGADAQEYVSFLGVCLFAAAWWLLANLATARVARAAFACVLAAAVASGVAAFVAGGWFSLGSAAGRSLGFNLIGTVNGHALFLAVVMMTGVSAWAVSDRARGGLLPGGRAGVAVRALIALEAALTLLTAAVVDSWLVWAALAAGSLLLIAFLSLRRGADGAGKRLAVPFVLMVLSVSLLFARAPIRAELPVVVSPSYASSASVARSALSEGWERALFGAGPGTFSYEYAQYRPLEVNATPFWNVRFDRAASYALTVVAAYGILGALAALFGTLALAAWALRRLTAKGAQDDAWNATLALFVGFSLSAGAHLFHPSNFSLLFLAWGLAGLLAAQLSARPYVMSFERSPRAGLLVSLVAVGVAVGVLSGAFAVANGYVAEIAFARAVALDRAGEAPSAVAASAMRAVSYNGASDEYLRNASAAALAVARAELAAARAGDAPESASARVAELASEAARLARRAAQAEPGNALNWVVLGSVYRDALSSVSGSEDMAAAAYRAAISLEPNNPSYYVALGRVHLAVADRARLVAHGDDPSWAEQGAAAETTQLAEAEAAFLAAAERKADYAPAHYFLAATYERQGRLEEAVTRMAALSAAHPDDAGVRFQLAMLYLRHESFALAEAELKAILAVTPEHANALWYLSALRERAGDRDGAIALLEEVARLNPDNADVAARLAQLRAGTVADPIPEPVEGEPTADATEVGE